MNIILLTICMIFFGCNGNPKSDKTGYDNSRKITQRKQHIGIKSDSIIVKYWKNTEANEYSYKYSDRELEIKSQYFGVNIKNSDTTTINKFITYVNEFYIDKSEKIILRKKENEQELESDFPEISAIGYANGQKVFDKKTVLRNHIKFNPKFLEFYEFLDNLVKKE